MDKAEIVTSLELSASAYRNIQPYTPQTCVATIDDPESGTQCFLRRSGDILRITFRGTDTAAEWRSNFTFWRKSIPYGNFESKIKVHTGFLNSYKTAGVRDKILASITAGTHYIKISGHSRGAALAVLCAVDLQYGFPALDIEAVLFGCPRVGNKAFARSYDRRVGKTVRVENGNDIVTKIPFALMGYRHVGAKLHIGRARLPLRFDANDHYPSEYYSSLIEKTFF